MSSVPRIYVSSSFFVKGKVNVSGADYVHLVKVLRLGVGDAVTVCDMQSTEYASLIEQIHGNYVTLSLGPPAPSPTESDISITLYQAIPKHGKIELIVQKAVELGAAKIVLVSCERCVGRYEKSDTKKMDRLQRVSEAAAAQSARGIIPAVHSPITFEECLNGIMETDFGFVCYEGEKTTMLKDFARKSKQNPKSAAFLIGPEGGLSQAEITKIKEKGIPLAGLGERILRTETASMYVLSAIDVLFG